MISKALIKQVRLLHQKKHRDEQGLFIAEGPKIIKDLLNSTYKVREIFTTHQFKIQNLPEELLRNKFKVQEVSEKELESISPLATPNQVLGVFEMKTNISSPKGEIFQSPFLPSRIASAKPASAERGSALAKHGRDLGHLILALDDIRDPGNLGTIIRVADWFGINHILCSETCVDVYNPKTVQATMGSIARVDVHYENLASRMEDMRKRAAIKIFGAVMNGKNIYTEKLSDKGIILIGNESRGISENLIQYVTHKISIPNFGKADSLNAAIATAVICSEFRRR